MLTFQIVSIVFFNFICYLTIGLPLAVLPTYVTGRLGFGAVAAGMVISIQYLATLLSRARAGRMSDALGPKRTVLYGLVACGASGAFLILTALLEQRPWLALFCLFIGRLVLGCGESFVATGATLWGIGRVGAKHTAQVISWNGVATYTAIAIGAPLGVLLESRCGFLWLGVVVGALAWLSLPLASLKPPSAVITGELIPLRRVLMRIMPFGLGLLLGSVGFGSIATFITLFYADRHWPNAALALTGFAVVFVGTRLLLSPLIDSRGGARVAMASFVVECAGLTVMGLAHSPGVALAGTLLSGAGFALIFPSLGVEAVARVTEENRGVALGLYSVFTDLALGLTGPLGGILANALGYAAIFLFAAAAALAALVLTWSVQGRSRLSSAPQTIGGEMRTLLLLLVLGGTVVVSSCQGVEITPSDPGMLAAVCGKQARGPKNAAVMAKLKQLQALDE